MSARLGFCVLVGVVAALTAVAKGPRLLTPPPGAVVPLLDQVKKDYLALPRAERRRAFVDKTCRNRLRESGCHPLPVDFRWDVMDPAELRLYAGDRCVFITNGAVGCVRCENLEIARTYRWSVKVGGQISVSTFKTEDVAPRLLKVDGVVNMRDLGGRIGLEGRRVRQGRVFRSGELNRAAIRDRHDRTAPWTPARLSLPQGSVRYLCETLGVRTDLDLRDNLECTGMTGSPLGSAVRWVHLESERYGTMQSPRGKAIFGKTFAVFLDEGNYPIDLHCIAGQDRTGSVAFILNGLLGVSEEELYRDWESTAFWNSNVGFCHDARLDKLVVGLSGYPGATLNQKIESYVKSVGFSDKDIRKFREIMLEPIKEDGR